MNQGDLVLSTDTSSFVSKAIRWFTSSQFSHSFIVAPDILEIPIALEAVENGVDMSRFDTNYQNNSTAAYEVWTVNIPQETKDAALKQVLNDLEILYGFFEYIYFIVRKICKIFGKDIKSKNNWFSHNGMICSQLCVAYLQTCGLGDLFKDYGDGSIAPQDLQDIFLANPKLFTKIESVRF